MKHIGGLLVVGMLFFPFCNIHSQETSGISPSDITGSISLILSPSVPTPNTLVTVTLEASGINLNLATIRWSANGQEIAGSTNRRSIQIASGSLGSQTTVRVSIITGEEIFNESITLSPAEIDILWQGDSYTPPFYKGRSLWGAEGAVTLYAIPHVYSNGSKLNPSSLNYKWNRNGTVMKASSGIGKNFFTFSDSVLSKPQVITLEVYSGDTVAARTTMMFTPSKPEVLVYERNPLYGFFFNQEAGNSYLLREREVSFSAFPYFASIKNRFGSLMEYEWRTNTQGFEKGNTVTYRTPENSSGSSNISIRAYHKEKIWQDSKKSFSIQFGSQSE